MQLYKQQMWGQNVLLWEHLATVWEYDGAIWILLWRKYNYLTSESTLVLMSLTWTDLVQILINVCTLFTMGQADWGDGIVICRITMLKCTFTMQWFCRNISNTRQSLQECITTRMHTHSFTWKLQSKLYLFGRVDSGPCMEEYLQHTSWDYMPLSEQFFRSVEKWRVGRGS